MCLTEVWTIAGCVMRSTCREIGDTMSRTSAYRRLCGILRAGFGCLVPVPGATPSDRPCPRTLRRLSCAAASPVCVDVRRGRRPSLGAFETFSLLPLGSTTALTRRGYDDGVSLGECKPHGTSHHIRINRIPRAGPGCRGRPGSASSPSGHRCRRRSRPGPCCGAAGRGGSCRRCRHLRCRRSWP